MKKPTLLLIAALFIVMTATSVRAQIKYVAVVETEIDEQSGAAAKLNRAEVRLMTAELRSTAVKNLPRDRFNIMTSETVMSQGSAKLEECAEENCVIALGAKIGADYIVRGIVSKLGTNLTMSVEMYETEDGNLVATSGVVRSENIADLVDKAAAACAEMYKTFVSTQHPAPKAPAVAQEPPSLEVAAAEHETVPTAKSGTESKAKKIERAEKSEKPKKNVVAAEPQMPLERKPMTGFLLGFNFNSSYPSYGVGHYAAQLGIVHSRPIKGFGDMLSLNAEGNVLAGAAMSYSGFFGVNTPATVLLQWHFLSVEAGADMDLLFGDDVTLFNAGFVTGAGIGFSKKRSRRYFYRYCGGYAYSAHVIGMRWLF